MIMGYPYPAFEGATMSVKKLVPLLLCQTKKLGLAVVDLAKHRWGRGSLARSTNRESGVDKALRCVLVILFTACSTTLRADEKLPVPSSDEQAASLELIKSIFEEQYASAFH